MWAPPTPARTYKHWHITLCVFVPLLYEPVQPMQRVSHLDPANGMQNFTCYTEPEPPSGPVDGGAKLAGGAHI